MCKVVWVGVVDNCNSCNKPFDGSGPMYDAHVKAFRCWANICEACFIGHGCVTGVGFGQKYELQELGENKKGWVKVAG